MFHVMSIAHHPPVMGGFYCKISSMVEWWSPKPQTGVRYPYLAFAKESHPYSRKRVCLLREKGETILGGEELIYDDTNSIPYFQTNTTPKWTMLR